MTQRVNNILRETPLVKSGNTVPAQKTKCSQQTFNYEATEADKMRGCQIEKSDSGQTRTPSIKDIPMNKSDVRDASDMDISKMDLSLEDLLRLKTNDKTILSDEQRAILNKRDEVQRLYGWKFENKAEFDNYYIDAAKAGKTGENNKVFSEIYERPVTKVITMEGIKICQDAGAFDILLPENVVFPADTDWSKSREVFKYISWNEKTFSQIPKEHLPEGFDPQKVFENGKKLGLGLEEAHKMGYTGEGVSIAVMDWNLKPHEDITSKTVFQGEYASSSFDCFHASAVNSIISGQTIGVAPGADTYHFAEIADRKQADGGKDMINAFKALIAKNKELPDDKKIRIVSISGPIYGGEEAEKLVKELNDSGVWVFSSDTFWKDFAYLGKKDPMGDNNDFDNYQKERSDSEDPLYVTCGDRTVASPEGENAYRHDSIASASWAIPVAAGYYALACQADPSMTPDRFLSLARQTAQVKQSNEYIDVDNLTKGRTTETKPIKIIDIKALLKAIEAERTK